MARITKDPEVRKQEILDAAMELFREKGYEKTSIGDIAEKLKIAQGLCYRYFPSKEKLFDSAVERYADLQVEQMLPVLRDPNRTLREKLDAVPAFPEVERRDESYYQVFHGPDSRHFHDRLSLCICGKIMPVLAEQIRKAEEAGEIDAGDARTAASFCVYGQLGILLAGDLTPEEKLGRIRAFLLRFFRL